MAESYRYYVIWSGSLHLGDTPGVFMDAQFAGLLLQLPVTITSAPQGTGPVGLRLTTTEVEVFGGRKHPVFWDWTPGATLPEPVGFIDDEEPVPGHPEFHQLAVPAAAATPGRHWVTIQVNPDVAAGLRDDFVLRRVEAHETIGAKFGW